MKIELTPKNAAVVADQSQATGRSFDETVNDILDLYSIASQMPPIIPPPTVDRDVVDSWDPSIAAD
jgi:hypothetical protein